jgi:hypothetical protein
MIDYLLTFAAGFLLGLFVMWVFKPRNDEEYRSRHGW